MTIDPGREEMLADFDAMTSILEEVFPLFEVNRTVFGSDVRAELARHREQVAKAESPVDFYRIVSDALTACRGNHLWTWDVRTLTAQTPLAGKIWPHLNQDELAVNHAIHQQLAQERETGRLPLKYYDGAYYTENRFRLDGVEYPYGMKLLAVNGEAVDSILPRLQSQLNFYDRKRKRFYGSDSAGSNFYSLLPGRERMDFDFLGPASDRKRLTLRPGNRIERLPPAHPQWKQPESIFYFDDRKILYLRVPSMALRQENPFRQIAEKFRGREIRAAVIDIRFNGGGGDSTWKSLLERLIREPLHWEITAGIRNSRRILDHIRHVEAFGRRELGFEEAALEFHEEEIPFLNVQKLLISRRTETISPAPDTLGLDCPIYILTHNIYSSAARLVAAARQSGQLHSVGLPSAVNLGGGLDMMLFVLPHSKLHFTIDPMIDLSGAESALDTMQLAPETELEIPPEEFFAYWNAETGENRFEYLSAKDPFMKRLFHLAESRNPARRS